MLISKYTKIMQNGVQSKFKRSKLDQKTGHYVYLTFIIQMLLCLFVSLFHVLYLLIYKDDFTSWISFAKSQLATLFITKYGNWLLILGLVNQ